MTVLYYILDGPTNWPIHVAGIITEYNLMKYEVAYDRFTLYIYIYILDGPTNWPKHVAGIII